MNEKAKKILLGVGSFLAGAAAALAAVLLGDRRTAASVGTGIDGAESGIDAAEGAVGRAGDAVSAAQSTAGECERGVEELRASVERSEASVGRSAAILEQVRQQGVADSDNSGGV